MRQEIKDQLSSFNLSEDLGSLDLDSLERAEDFQHLIMIGTYYVQLDYVIMFFCRCCCSHRKFDIHHSCYCCISALSSSI